MKAFELFDIIIKKANSSDILEIQRFGVKALFKKVKGYQLSSEIVINQDLMTQATERAKKIHGTEKHKDVA